MTIKIISNPYSYEIKYLVFNKQNNCWDNLDLSNLNSKLREDESVRNFLPFRIKDIIDIIIDEYYNGGEKINIYFEGTQEEFVELQHVCQAKDIAKVVELFKTNTFLENARVIFGDIRNIFSNVKPIIESIISDDKKVIRDLNKISDALEDIIPICVFGNYSSGKSTFINALIGNEILPSGDNPVTAKIYKIRRSRQSDEARIRFEYNKEKFEFLFEDKGFRVFKGEQDNELVKRVFERLEEIDANENTVEDNLLSQHVNVALDIINGFEKKDKNVKVISNVIEIDIPFSREGILGESYNNFVIFDTPGSNSESNSDHAKVLSEALDGFSNGIPVWVTSLETVDTNDNATLCDKILKIDALDARFTMIIFNKADCSNVEGDHLTVAMEKKILEYNSVEKMYSAGIYFTSSIMGLGSKNKGKFLDHHYRKMYRAQKIYYNDPDDVEYTRLYKYNIMPYQIKEDMIASMSVADNLVYANSGLMSVEQEMENFASKYAAYNKCQMVYMFLKSVIDEANKRIDVKTNVLKTACDKLNNELDTEKAHQIEVLKSKADEAERKIYSESKDYTNTFIDDMGYLECDIEHFKAVARTSSLTNKTENDFVNVKKKSNEAVDIAVSNVKNIIGGEGKFGDRLKAAGQGVGNAVSRWNEMKNTKREIDKKTSDDIIENATELYRDTIIIAQGVLAKEMVSYWSARSNEFKVQLIQMITENDSLSDSEKDELKTIIVDNTAPDFDGRANEYFKKSRFLMGNILGVHVLDNERINIEKLHKSYNAKIVKDAKKIGSELNENSYSEFKSWKLNLVSELEDRIVDYNPQLRTLASVIKEETERINKLADDQREIMRSLESIEDWMQWKDA